MTFNQNLTFLVLFSILLSPVKGVFNYYYMARRDKERSPGGFARTPKEDIIEVGRRSPTQENVWREIIEKIRGKEIKGKSEETRESLKGSLREEE